jgi:prefoldin subunit 5
VKLEVEELQKEIENYVEQLKTVDDTIQQYEEQIQELLDKMKLSIRSGCVLQFLK